MRSTLLLCSLLAAGAPALAQASRRTYLHEARDQAPEAPGLLEELEGGAAEGDAQRAARAADRLLELTMDGARASALVEAGPHRFQGLRAAVLERIGRLPPAAREALAGLQDQGARGLRLGDRAAPSELLARRYPCAGDGREAQLELMGRALEVGAQGRAQALRARLLSAHPEARADLRLGAHEAFLALLQGDPAAVGTALQPLRRRPEAKALVERLEQARRALEAHPRPAPSPPGAAGRTPPPGSRLVERGSALLPPPPPVEGSYAPALPLVVGERVLVGSGSQLLVLDLSGKLLARLPALAESAAPSPPEQTRFMARLWARGELCAAPLVLERWLAPARGAGGGGGRDPSFAGSFYSLLLADPGTGRLLWWDGDPGPVPLGAEVAGGQDGSTPLGPPGLGRAPQALRERLRRAHVLAVTGDEDRIYAALLFQGDDLELGVFAWKVDTGSQPVLLTPAWSAVTHLFAAERAGDLGGDEAAVHPEVAAALALDDTGRLVVTTDVGVVACLDTLEGDVQWLHDAPPPRVTRPGGIRPRLELVAPGPVAPPEPARQLGPDLVAFVHGDHVVGASLARGEPAWTLGVGEPARTVLLDPERLVVYAGDRLLLLHAASGQALFSLQLPGERCAGEGVVWGDGLMLPVVDGGASRVRRVELRGARGRGLPGGGGVLLLGSEWPCPNHRGPFNLAAASGPAGPFLVAASSRRVSLVDWEARGR